MISRITNKVVSSLVAIASLIVIVYFGTVIYKQFKPQTLEEKIMRCLELGSDKRASACIKLLPDKPKASCHFEILEIEELSGGDVGSGSFYKIYKGTIRNTSYRKEHLKAMIGKLYTKDNTLIQTGYDPIEQDIDSGMSITFEINVQGSIEGDLISDIYPWFTTCN